MRTATRRQQMTAHRPRGPGALRSKSARHTKGPSLIPLRGNTAHPTWGHWASALVRRISHTKLTLNGQRVAAHYGHAVGGAISSDGRLCVLCCVERLKLATAFT